MIKEYVESRINLIIKKTYMSRIQLNSITNSHKLSSCSTISNQWILYHNNRKILWLLFKVMDNKQLSSITAEHTITKFFWTVFKKDEEEFYDSYYTFESNSKSMNTL